LDLVDLRVDLEPWDAEDTTGFLQLALVAAGAGRPIFDEAALAEIHRLSGGVPRLVNRLADYALVAGSSAGLELIDEETVATAYAAISPPVRI
jgi:type II secretory pathway predicted ATPase ExeA